MRGRILLALGQIAIVAGLAAQAEWHLQQGTRVRLATEPVDPRSLFQGDYVRLGYPIARTAPGFTPQPGEAVWLTLAPQGDVWAVTALSRDRPPAPAVAMRATFPPMRQDRLILGLETMFVPEGKGLDLERAVPGRVILVEAAIGSDGTARPAALVVDGQVAYRSGLF